MYDTEPVKCTLQYDKSFIINHEIQQEYAVQNTNNM